MDEAPCLAVKADGLCKGSIHPDERRARLNQRIRDAFIEGAEADSLRRLGRGLTSEELERVLRHYPGDVGWRGGPRNC